MKFSRVALLFVWHVISFTCVATEQGLEEDLRGSSQYPAYQDGSFPRYGNESTNLYTSCYKPVPSTSQAQKASLDASPASNLPPFYVEECKDGRCRLVQKETKSVVQKEVGKPERVLRKIIPGKDGRTRITETHDFPYSFHGHMIMAFANGKEYVGSGTLIGPHHVLTAGHNLYSHEDGEGWAVKVIFIPAHNEDRCPFGQAEGTILLSTDGYVNYQEEEEDFGMVILDKTIGYRTGWAGLFYAPDSFLENLEIHVTGYPGDKGTGDKQSTQMWTMSHKPKSLSPEELKYEIDTYRGQSGSGIWASFHDYGDPSYYVVGIHAYGNEKAQVNKGPRLSLKKMQLICSWLDKYQLENFIHPDLKSNRYFVRSLEERLRENLELLDSSEGKDIAVFIGKTGSGKSTLINYLSEKALSATEDGDIVLEDPDSSAMAIGDGSSAQTRLPQCVNIDDLLFYDLPGLDDTEGPSEELINVILIKHIIEKANSVRLVAVAGLDEVVSGRGSSFKDLVFRIKRLLPSDIDISGCSSCIITRSDKQKNRLIPYLTTKIAEGHHYPWITNPNLPNPRIAQMSKPRDGIIDPTERQPIIDTILSTIPVKIEKINIKALYGHLVPSFLKELIEREMSPSLDGLVHNIKGQISRPKSRTSLDTTRTFLKKAEIDGEGAFQQKLGEKIASSKLITLLKSFDEDGAVYEETNSSLKSRTEAHRTLLELKCLRKIAQKDKKIALCWAATIVPSPVALPVALHFWNQESNYAGQIKELEEEFEEEFEE